MNIEYIAGLKATVLPPKNELVSFWPNVPFQYEICPLVKYTGVDYDAKIISFTDAVYSESGFFSFIILLNRVGFFLLRFQAGKRTSCVRTSSTLKSSY